MTQVNLKPIIDQLTECLSLPEGLKVSALIDDDEIIGWTVVKVENDGKITPIFNNFHFNSLKELFEYYK